MKGMNTVCIILAIILVVIIGRAVMNKGKLWGTEENFADILAPGVRGKGIPVVTPTPTPIPAPCNKSCGYCTTLNKSLCECVPNFSRLCRDYFAGGPL